MATEQEVITKLHASCADKMQQMLGAAVFEAMKLMAIELDAQNRRIEALESELRCHAVEPEAHQ